jgi:ferredoxin
MINEAYRKLAMRLDATPNGFPPTESGVELELLATLYTPDEAALAAELRPIKESPDEVAARIGGEPATLRKQLKGMARRGLIAAGATESGLGYGLLPFVVGIYEMQAGRLTPEMAQLFETYYLEAFGRELAIEPSVHRVIPIGESVRMDMEIRPYESASDIVANAQAWGVLDCICRQQKGLIGEPCGHPVDICMAFGNRPGAFDGNPVIKSLTQDEAMDNLKRAADAGLVHSVSNNREGLWYICNCCTCSCGILRGLAELGIANAVARSAFVNQVDEELCNGCELCIDACQFDALSMADEFFVKVDQLRCLGCGVCVPECLEGALALMRRPEDEIKPVPTTSHDWGMERAAARGMEISFL